MLFSAGRYGKSPEGVPRGFTISSVVWNVKTKKWILTNVTKVFKLGIRIPVQIGDGPIKWDN